MVPFFSLSEALPGVDEEELEVLLQAANPVVAADAAANFFRKSRRFMLLLSFILQNCF